MVTMADVGRAAGVSASTVSHVLNGTRTVSDSTRDLVLTAIATTGYRHNVLARSLATSSTMALGLAISTAANPYFGELIRAVERNARTAGYMLMLADTHDDDRVERRVVEELINRRLDGILLAPSPGAVDEAVPFLLSAGVPTVLLDRFADVDLDQVGSENTRSTARLVDHLADLGHHRIAMVGGLRGLRSSTERVAGFTHVVDARRLDDDPALVLDGASDTALAEQAVLRAFRGRSRPTAVVVGNNAMTIGTLRALRAVGLRVPADVAMVCYDDFEWADVFDPGLTAMRQDVAQIGRTAVELVIGRIKDPTSPPRRHVVAPTYQHRDSCGCRAATRRVTEDDAGTV